MQRSGFVALLLLGVLCARPSEGQTRAPRGRAKCFGGVADCGGAQVAVLSSLVAGVYDVFVFSRGVKKDEPALNLVAAFVGTTGICAGALYAHSSYERGPLRWGIPIAAGITSIPALIFGVYGFVVGESAAPALPSSTPPSSSPMPFDPWGTTDRYLRLESPAPTLIVDASGRFVPGIAALRGVF